MIMICSTSLLTENGIGQVVNVRIVWTVLIADQCDSMDDVEIDTRTPRWTVFVSPVAVCLFILVVCWFAQALRPVRCLSLAWRCNVPANSSVIVSPACRLKPSGIAHHMTCTILNLASHAARCTCDVHGFQTVFGSSSADDWDCAHWQRAGGPQH